jgi:NADH-quinone oxidoreductase subunit J
MELLTAHGPAVLFYFFAALALVAALGVVTLRNPMYGAVSLLTCFLAVAVLFFLRHAEFLGVVQIFVYGGGIMVLFLFVIMLVNLHQLRESRLFASHAGAALVVAAILVLLFGLVFVPLQFPVPDASPVGFVQVGGERVGNSQAVAWELYRTYLLPFEIVSLFLLVAMIGAVVLGRRQ